MKSGGFKWLQYHMDTTALPLGFPGTPEVLAGAAGGRHQQGSP